MSKRAEEAAMKAYPPTHSEWKRNSKRVQSALVDTHQPLRTIFQRGYDQAEKDFGWHSVEESLPPIDEEVIVLTDAPGTAPIYKIGFGHIVDEETTIYIDGKPYKAESHNGWNIPGVKYWMPCPRIPGSSDM